MEKDFSRIRISAPCLIAVSINSGQGTYAQAEEIVKRLQDYSKKFQCPIYTFAEDMAIGPGYYVLASGNRVFADPFSLLGGISANLQSLDLVKFSQDQGIKQNLFATSKQKVRVNPFKELTETDKKWVQGLLDDRIQIVKNQIMQRRAHKVPRNAESEELALSGDVFMGKKAVELGLVDSIHTFRSILNKEYYDCRVIQFKNKATHTERRGSASGLNLQDAEDLEILDEMSLTLISNRLSVKIVD